MSPATTVAGINQTLLEPVETTSNIGSNVTGQVSDVVGQASDIFVNNPNTIVDTVSGLQGQFNDAVVNAPNTISDTISNVVGQGSDLLVNNPNTIIDSVSGLQGQFNDAVVNAPNTVSDTVSNVVGQASDILVNNPNTIVGTVSDLQGQLNEALFNVPNTVTGTVSNITGQIDNLADAYELVGEGTLDFVSIPGVVVDTANSAYEGFTNVINAPTDIFEASKVGNNVLIYYLGEGAGAESVLSPFHNPLAKAEGVKEATDKYGTIAAPYGYIKGELTADFRQAAAKELESYQYSYGDASTASLQLNEETLAAYQTLLANTNGNVDADAMIETAVNA